MDINEMLKVQVETFQSDRAQNVELLVAEAHEAETREEKIAALREAIKAQTAVVNATWNYDVDRRDVGGPTPLYVFVKAVRTAIRDELNVLLGKGQGEAAKVLRARFDSIIGQ